MHRPVVHVIGAGLAGLAAAVRLSEAGRDVVVHEATGQAGGRCRSYHEPALGVMIDNGNHLILSGNHATLSYLRVIGAEDRLQGPATAEFPFVDLATNERWTLRLNESRLPWWIFDARRRVPGTGALDYLSLARLLLPGRRGKSIGDVLNCSGVAYDKLIRPLLLAALNTDPREGSARLAAAVVRETFAAGGRACRPLIARNGLAGAFVDPALRFLATRGASIHFGHRLQALAFGKRRVEALDFGKEIMWLADDDAVIIAVPPVVAATLVPGVETPCEFRAIVNAHFRLRPPEGFAPITAVLNGTIEWIFAFPDRLAITISSADRLLDVPRETLARQIWSDVSKVAGVAETLPPWQIVREIRATFAATPKEDAKRPGAQTAWNNLFLAGDWIATGLPATIEGAIRSGNRAAELVSRRQEGRRATS